MDHVPKPEGRVPSKHHTRLSEIVAEVTVDAGVVLQLVGLNELEGTKRLLWKGELQHGGDQK